MSGGRRDQSPRLGPASGAAVPARRSRRRRSRKGGLVVISWRDIPAQVNASASGARVQRILPRRFQRAIDRAAMVAGKTQASQYVGEWRRSVVDAGSPDPEIAAREAAAKLEEAFPMERLNKFVKTGGWDPDRAESHAPQEESHAPQGDPK